MSFFKRAHTHRLMKGSEIAMERCTEGQSRLVTDGQSFEFDTVLHIDRHKTRRFMCAGSQERRGLEINRKKGRRKNHYFDFVTE